MHKWRHCLSLHCVFCISLSASFSIPAQSNSGSWEGWSLSHLPLDKRWGTPSMGHQSIYTRSCYHYLVLIKVFSYYVMTIIVILRLNIKVFFMSNVSWWLKAKTRDGLKSRISEQTQVYSGDKEYWRTAGGKHWDNRGWRTVWRDEYERVSSGG